MANKTIKRPFMLRSLLLLCLAYLGSCQQCRPPTRPEAIYSRTRLPQEDYGMSLAYDGDDTILTFSMNYDKPGIYRFSITSEDIEWLAPIPFTSYRRSAPLVRIQDGSYLYFGNDYTAPRVLNYNSATNSSSIVAELPFKMGDISSSFTSSDPTKVYLLVDKFKRSVDIQEFDTDSFCLSLMTSNLTAQTENVPTLVFGDFAYVFAKDGMTFQIHKDTLEVTSVGRTNVKFDWSYTASVTTSKYGYMVGGYNRFDFPTDGILQYNQVDNEFTFIRIDGVPQGFGAQFNHPRSMVFVEKLNRIYFFGGAAGQQTRYDFIWYIDAGLME